MVAQRLIAGNQHHHSHICPPAFSALLVEQGSRGAGANISFREKPVVRRGVTAQIKEPEPDASVQRRIYVQTW
jgi:hypothetical protein